MVKTLIVENEPLQAKVLREAIDRNFADLQIVAICDNVKSSLDAIDQHQPELLFLDVELNGKETGFHILQKLALIDFKVIFTTAFDKYAIQAIKLSAIDYLLKPIDEDELRKSVLRFMSNRLTTSPEQHHAIVTHRYNDQQSKIGLPVIDGLEFVQVSDILFCKGESSQASIHMEGGKQHIVSRTLKECDTLLTQFDFCRIHRSITVNLRHVTRYRKGDGGYVILADGTLLNVSKSYKSDLLAQLSKL
jgi:two-component system, LytTR family, response regulator